jgi:membrane protein DedA with SNARE-associated domain
MDAINYLEIFWTLLQQGQLPEVGRWNYLLLAVLTAIEGPIATLLAAGASSAGLMRFWVAFAAAAAGNMAADSLWYLLGYSGRVETALKIGRLFGLKRRHVDHLTSAMRQHGVKILFFAKLTEGFMIPSLVAAGLARLPYKRWFPVVMVAEAIWTGTLMVIGFHTTEAIRAVSQEIGHLSLAVSIVFLAIIIWQARRILMRTPAFEEAMHGKEHGFGKPEAAGMTGLVESAEPISKSPQ